MHVGRVADTTYDGGLNRRKVALNLCKYHMDWKIWVEVFYQRPYHPSTMLKTRLGIEYQNMVQDAGSTSRVTARELGQTRRGYHGATS